MAKKHDILYVNFYTGGSAAHKVDLTQPMYPQEAPAPVSRPRPQKRTVVHVDPLAMISILVSAVMLVLMVAGMVTLNDAHAQQTRMEKHVQGLQVRNEELRTEFDEKYDPAAIEKKALALGLVPVDQVEHITVRVEQVTEVPEEPSLWEQVLAFFDGLFA